MVIETFDGQLLANVDDNLYLMEEVAEHELVSKEFDAPKEAPKKEKKKYIPPMDHPWRKNSFMNYALQNKSTVVVLMFDYFETLSISVDRRNLIYRTIRPSFAFYMHL